MADDLEPIIVTPASSHGRPWPLRSYITVAVYFVVNLVNYMDRYTTAAISAELRSPDVFDVDAKMISLVQTSFIISYMLCSPIFGYLGDRYNRKYLCSVGLLFWTIVSLASSFVPNHYFGWFLVLRAMVGVGEASYSTLAPTVLADIFVGRSRTIALTVFQTAVPLGSGLGYIIGSGMLSMTGNWQWCYRIVPILTTLAGLLLFFGTEEPPRGAAEHATNTEVTSYKEDLRYLTRVPSYIFINFGFVCIAFSLGALSFWAPVLVQTSVEALKNETAAASNDVGLVFGALSCTAGVVGVFVGTSVAYWLRRYTDAADAVVCAAGLIAAGPLSFGAIIVTSASPVASYVLCFFALACLCLNWVLVIDMTMYVIVPTRRSTAEAAQILLGHLLGDAASPLICAAIYDSLNQAGETAPADVRLTAYQDSLYLTSFISILGGVCFLMASRHISADKRTCARDAGEVDDSVSDTDLISLADKTSAQTLSIDTND